MLAAIPEMIREIVEAQEQVRFDRAHFKDFGAYALNFEVVYWIQSPDYNLYMDIQQAINLAIFRRFDEAGIAFAYPSQTLFVDTSEARGPQTSGPQPSGPQPAITTTSPVPAIDSASPIAVRRSEASVRDSSKACGPVAWYMPTGADRPPRTWISPS